MIISYHMVINIPVLFYIMLDEFLRAYLMMNIKI